MCSNCQHFQRMHMTLVWGATQVHALLTKLPRIVSTSAESAVESTFHSPTYRSQTLLCLLDIAPSHLRSLAPLIQESLTFYTISEKWRGSCYCIWHPIYWLFFSISLSLLLGILLLTFWSFQTVNPKVSLCLSHSSCPPEIYKSLVCHT